MVSIKHYKDPKLNTKEDFDLLTEFGKYFSESIGTNAEKLANFTKFVSRQNLTHFLARYELFKKILHVHGSIIDCGILFGGGLMTFAKLSSIFEPVNYQRKITGFDTFAGYPKLSKKDQHSNSTVMRKGGLKIDTYDDFKRCIELYDSNRFLNHIPKVELVKGNAVRTIPKYLKDNPQTVVSLLYLDFGPYEPTKVALENFLPRMPKGSIVAFEVLNNKGYTGETKAALDSVGINNLRLQRFNFESNMSYAIIE